jgi:hypothetical protein
MWAQQISICFHIFCMHIGFTKKRLNQIKCMQMWRQNRWAFAIAFSALDSQRRCPPRSSASAMHLPVIFIRFCSVVDTAFHLPEVEFVQQALNPKPSTLLFSFGGRRWKEGSTIQAFWILVFPYVPNDVPNMSPIFLCVPQNVPNSTTLYPIILAQSWTFITYKWLPKGSTFIFWGLPNVLQNKTWWANLSGSFPKNSFPTRVGTYSFYKNW